MDSATKIALLKVLAPCAVIATIGTFALISESLKASRAEELRRRLASEKLVQDVTFYELSKRFYAENPHLNPDK